MISFLKVLSILIVYFLALNCVNDAEASEWNATYHNAPVNQPFNNQSAGKTLVQLNDETNIGYASNAISLKWSGATPPTASNGQEATPNIDLLLSSEQLFRSYTDWSNGNITTDYYPIPPDTSDELRQPLTFDANSSFLHNPEVLPESYSYYASAYPTKHFVITITGLKAFAPQYMSFLTANPPAGNEGYIYGPVTRFVNGRMYYTVTPSVGNSFELYMSVGYPNCANGYSMSDIYLDSMQCDLSDANQVQLPKDSICEAKLTNGEFVYSTRDLDCNTLSVTGLGRNNDYADSTFIASTPEKTLYLVSSAAGTVSAYEKTYNAANDATKTLIGNIFSDLTVNYLQELNTSGNQTAIAPSVIDPSNGNNGGSSGGETENSNAKLDEIFQDGEIPDTDTFVSDDLLNPFANIFIPLNNYQIPQQAGICPTVDITYFDPPKQFDMHCAIFDNNKFIIQSGLVIVYLVAGIRIVLSA